MNGRLESFPPRARVVITGIGLATPFAATREISWRSLCAGGSATRWLQPEVSGWDEPGLSTGIRAGAPAPDVTKRTDDENWDPVVSLAITAAQEAVQDAALRVEEIDSDRAGCVIGTSKGGLRSFTRAMRRGPFHGPPHPEWLMQFMPNAPAAWVAGSLGFQGAALCPISACATGLQSLARGADLIRDGFCDVVVAGSADASLQPSLLASFHRMGVLARGFDDPRSACRPFDRRRNGFLVGEGAAVLVMERSDHAYDRGVVPYVEWITHATASDVSGITQVDEQAESLTWLIRHVMRSAALTSGELDYVNLHGTATVPNDICETRALRFALGTAADHVSCSSAKGALGHLLGAAGSAETAATILAMRDGLVPPTANLEQHDAACDLDFTPCVSRPRRIENALKLSLGFGGHLVAVVLRQEAGFRPRPEI